MLRLLTPERSGGCQDWDEATFVMVKLIKPNLGGLAGDTQACPAFYTGLLNDSHLLSDTLLALRKRL